MILLGILTLSQKKRLQDRQTFRSFLLQSSTGLAVGPLFVVRAPELEFRYLPHKELVNFEILVEYTILVCTKHMMKKNLNLARKEWWMTALLDAQIGIAGIIKPAGKLFDFDPEELALLHLFARERCRTESQSQQQQHHIVRRQLL